MERSRPRNETCTASVGGARVGDTLLGGCELREPVAHNANGPLFFVSTTLIRLTSDIGWEHCQRTIIAPRSFAVVPDHGFAGRSYGGSRYNARRGRMPLAPTPVSKSAEIRARLDHPVDFVFTNPVSLWTGLNPNFFKGTALDNEVTKLLA